MTLYIKSSRNEGFVGIWWYTDDRDVIGVMTSVQSGYLDGRYIQYSKDKNHMNLWKKVVYDSFPNDSDEIYRLGYRGLERGRVIYDTMTQCYIITCSEELSKDKQFISDIKNAFDLNGSRCEIEVLNHYKKLPLTGNPAVDDQILNMDI